MGRRLYIDLATGATRYDRRLRVRNDSPLDRVYTAWRFLQDYANVLRGQMPLSSTEEDAAKAAAKILMGKKRA